MYHHLIKIILKQNIYILLLVYLLCSHQLHNTYVKSPLLRNWVLLFPSCCGQCSSTEWFLSLLWLLNQAALLRQPGLISSVALYCYFDFRMCETACLHIMFLKFYDNVWGSSRFIGLEKNTDAKNDYQSSPSSAHWGMRSCIPSLIILLIRHNNILIYTRLWFYPFLWNNLTHKAPV